MTTPIIETEEAQPAINPAFISLLQQHRNGSILNDVADAVREVIEAVQLAGKAGKLTITFTMAPSGATGAIIISDDIKVTLPKLPKQESLFFADDNGQLVRNDPRQRELPLRSIQGGAVEPTSLKGDNILDSALTFRQRVGREPKSPQRASNDFREWASCFSEGLFVMLKVYADESGTNDPTGQEPGSSIPSLAGYIESKNYWNKFRRKWKAVLDAARARSFHFREFSNPTLCAQDDCQYHGWSAAKRDQFLYDLAILSSERATVSYGGARARVKHDRHIPGNVYEITITKFYEDLEFVLDTYWPDYTGRILLVFDKAKNPDEKWIMPLHRIHSEFAKRDSRLGGLTFEDDEDELHLPLQAADFLAYVNRQYVESMTKWAGSPPLRTLDYILGRSRDTSCRSLKWPIWKRRIVELRRHQTQQEATWRNEGLKKTYYPLEHFHP